MYITYMYVEYCTDLSKLNNVRSRGSFERQIELLGLIHRSLQCGGTSMCVYAFTNIPVGRQTEHPAV